MLYFGKEVEACGIPDSKARAGSGQSHVFLRLSLNIFLGLSPKWALKKTLKNPPEPFFTLSVYVYYAYVQVPRISKYVILGHFQDCKSPLAKGCRVHLGTKPFKGK